MGKIGGRASIMGKSCCYDRNLRDWWSYGRNLRQWWKLIWLSVAIPRHAFINWFAITNRLATQDILLKWGYKGDSAFIAGSLCVSLPKESGKKL